MKYFYFFLLILVSAFANAQDTVLFDNTWYLTNLIADGKDNFPPINTEVPNIKLVFNQDQKILMTNVCNEGWSENINFDIKKNDFTIEGFYRTLILCNNLENEKFETLYFSFFTKNFAPAIFSYLISEADGLKTLTITSNNEQAVYTNQKLATKRFTNLFFSVFPNPANNFLNIIFNNSNSNNAKLTLYDSLGKLSLSQNIDNEHTSLNIQNLKKGLYLIQIKTQDAIETQKIIIK